MRQKKLKDEKELEEFCDGLEKTQEEVRKMDNKPADVVKFIELIDEALAIGTKISKPDRVTITNRMTMVINMEDEHLTSFGIGLPTLGQAVAIALKLQDIEKEVRNGIALMIADYNSKNYKKISYEQIVEEIKGVQKVKTDFNESKLIKDKETNYIQ